MVEKNNLKKILVVGAGGLLGSQMVRLLSKGPYIVKAATRTELDISKGLDVAIWIERLHPDIVINCAAYSNVDGCEDDSKQAFLVNAKGVKNLCLPLEESGGKLIHISTDYVFDGKKGSPYIESDPVNPMSHYAESKLKGEEYIQKLLPESLVARVQWLYGEHGHNFASTFIRKVSLGEMNESYSLIADRVGTPNDVFDIANGIEALMNKSAKGIVHLSSQGQCSWYDFGKYIYGINQDPKFTDQIKRVTESQAKRKAKRPRYSVMASTRLKKEYDFEMPHWELGLERTIGNIIA